MRKVPSISGYVLRVIRYLELRYDDVFVTMVLLHAILYLILRYYGVVACYTVFKITLLWCCYMLYCI